MKMSEPARRFALSGQIRLPEPLLPLLLRAVTQGDERPGGTGAR
jgi:hypothetical protein